jgi:hypothetical protein
VWGAGAKTRGPHAPMGFTLPEWRSWVRGAVRGRERKEGRNVGSREGSAAFHGALVRARFASEHVIGAGVAAFGFGRGMERGMEGPLGEAEGSWMWDVSERVARLRLLPVPASALGPTLPQSQLEQ